MVRIVKKSPVFLLLLSMTLLASCSPILTNTTSPSLVVSETQPAVVTSTAEQITPELARPTETLTIYPTETAFDENLIPPTHTPSADTHIADTIFADVLSVELSGSENAYQFLVEIRSPDTGCEQYADWWEVVSEDGDLLYRRILAHSHVNEQPFRRSGGAVMIDANTVVIVRAHMHPHGYGGMALRGSVEGGFEPVQLDANFAPNLDEIEPLPTGCAF